ncbi:MAG: nitrate/nitrite transporter NrtS [Pseudomonadota bacterium]
MKTWVLTAVKRDVIVRSGKVALLVGSILVLINQGDTIVGGHWSPELMWKIPLTYVVPYGVSTYASVAAILNKD